MIANSNHIFMRRMAAPSFVGAFGRVTVHRQPNAQACLRQRKSIQPRASRNDYDGKSKSQTINIKINNAELSIPQDSMWMLAIPAVAVVGVAALVGPAVIAMTAVAVGIGAAVSMGALAMAAAIFPLMMGLGFMWMILGGVFIVPKLISMVLALSGAAVGWFIVKTFLLPSPAPAVQQDPRASAPEDPDEVQRRERERELRSFDEMLARKDKENRSDRWRS